jgi:pimeloyl-ACP methyl ester carboxylesterase
MKTEGMKMDFARGTARQAGDLPARKTVRVGDIEMAYREYGEGDPLFMIAAYTATMETWDGRFIKKLALRNRVITFDNRGLGNTTSGSVPWSIAQFAADTTGLIDALGYDRANVLGWSLGGDIALAQAVYYPEIVDKLIVYAGDFGGPYKIDAPRYRDVLKKVRGNGYVPFEGALVRLFPPEWMKEHPDYWKSVPIPRRVRPWNIWRQNKAYEKWRGVYEELPSIENPVLLVTGTEDVSTPPMNADIMAERIPHSELVRFLGAGHGLMYQYPVTLSRVIVEFLSKPSGLYEAYPKDYASSLAG